MLLKLGSRLVYGEDLRDQLALAYPLAYPNAGDPFYGYTTKRLAAQNASRSMP